MIFKTVIKKNINYLNFIKYSYFSHYPKVTILLYHRIADQYYNHPYGSVVGKIKFKEQMLYFKKKFNLISLNNLFLQIKNQEFINTNQLVITFDDGSVDNYLNAYPILKNLSIPATFFLPTDYINSENITWDWKLYEIIYNTKNLYNFSKSKLSHIKYTNKKNLLLKLVNYFKFLKPLVRDKYINELSNILSFNNFDYINNKSLSWNQVKEMSSSLLEFGSHGCSHTSLMNQDFNFFTDELHVSKKTIENHLSKECHYFSFPFGSKDDFNKKLINDSFLFYKSCFLNISGSNNLKKNNLVFKRIIMDETTDLRYIF